MYLQMIQTVLQTFEHLARVSVFVDQARIGESLAINEPYSYERQFERIEDHHEHGLYWLLCAVQRLVHVTGNQVSIDAGLLRGGAEGHAPWVRVLLPLAPKLSQDLQDRFSPDFHRMVGISSYMKV